MGLQRDLALRLADAKQFTEAGSSMAREELESGQGIPCPGAYSVLIEQEIELALGRLTLKAGDVDVRVLASRRAAGS